MINRIRDIRRQKGLTLADLAAACEPPTTPQTVGRLETGMRNLSLKWMERIAAALGVEPEMLVRSESGDHPQVVATLEQAGPEARATPRDAILATDLGAKGRRHHRVGVGVGPGQVCINLDARSEKLLHVVL